MRGTVFAEVYDAALRTVHHQLFLRKADVDIYILPFFIEQLQSHNLGRAGCQFQLYFVSPFIIGQQRIDMISIPHLKSRNLPGFFTQ